MIDEFKVLLSKIHTFVDPWNDQLITPSKYRLYGESFQLKRLKGIDQNSIRFSYSKDVQNPHGCHERWEDAIESTKKVLDQKLKCQSTLVFVCL